MCPIGGQGECGIAEHGREVEGVGWVRKWGWTTWLDPAWALTEGGQTGEWLLRRGVQAHLQPAEKHQVTDLSPHIMGDSLLCLHQEPVPWSS